MTSPLAPSPDPTLQLAERQLVMLGELAEMAMAAARAFTGSAIASAKAEEAILADEYFVPEVGRARACGAKAAAESFQKAARAVRLTLMLEMRVAEVVRDIRAGVVTYIGGFTLCKDAGVLAGPSLEDRDSDSRPRDCNTEHLVDIERPDTLLRAPFRDTVEQICDDIGVEVDWTAWRLNPSGPTGETLLPPPADPSVRPPERSPPVPARPPG